MGKSVGHQLVRLERLGLLVCLALLGCSQPTPEELASLAAKGYYDHLIHGEYESFLEGLDLPDLPRVQGVPLIVPVGEAIWNK